MLADDKEFIKETTEKAKIYHTTAETGEKGVLELVEKAISEM